MAHFLLGPVSVASLQTTTSPSLIRVLDLPFAASGFAGITNQGATCYLNSLLQVLYHTRDLRRAIFEWGVESSGDGAGVGGVTRQLESLFAELQLTACNAVGTAALTRAFGWTDGEAFQQHDVHEWSAFWARAECGGVKASAPLPPPFRAAALQSFSRPSSARAARRHRLRLLASCGASSSGRRNSTSSAGAAAAGARGRRSSRAS